MRELVYHVATSLDGFIADAAGDFSQFPQDRETLAALFDRYPETCPAHLREALGVTGAPRRFDTVVMGRRTHAPALDAGLVGGAYPHLRQVVVTHRDLPASSDVEVVGGDVRAGVADLLAEPGKDVWLCGGADLAGQLVDLVDEIQVKVNPILLGDGIPLFRGLDRPRDVHAVAVEPLPGGVMLVTYRTRPRG
ncbi:dihydrofolate reductase family protein [Nocardioides sp.]|uniref:dihydrofolate reductase family protein n=1 Tax=Nocardioides sp. TaxID=35761 RepID=UPI00286A11DE|nr:dihydrofolate reductase family protein [Nocardioides sp.]